MVVLSKLSIFQAIGHPSDIVLEEKSSKSSLTSSLEVGPKKKKKKKVIIKLDEVDKTPEIEASE